MNSPGELTRIPVAFGDADGDVTAVVARAMTEARAAQSRWSRTPMDRRLELIRELRRLIAEHAPLLAGASASTRQRPALESLTAEVLPLAEACRFLERNAGRILAARRLGRRGLPLWLAGVRSEIHCEPLSVNLIIDPGNYPLLLPGVQLIQALAAGNAVLLKPGIGGTGAAHALIDLIVRAGLDPNLVALLPESPDAARAAIVARPDKVLCTGSADSGERILAQLAPHLIPATLELSGCDAVILRADADLALAVKALVFALTLNGGATCMSPKRVFVSAARTTELEGRLARALSALGSSRTGEMSEPNPSGRSLSPSAAAPPGPAAPARLLPLVEEAVAGGAHFLAGSERRLPAVLAAVPRTARLLREDIFAPVLSVVTVADDDEAVMLVNDCPFALTASIFSRNESAARFAARRHQAAARISPGWLCMDWAWQLRGALDRLLGGVGMRRGRRDPQDVRVGDAVDFWRLEAVEPNRLLRLRAEMKVSGRAWLEFQVEPRPSGGSLLSQTASFAPRGLAGLLYWYTLYPIHALIFSGLVKRLVRSAAGKTAAASSLTSHCGG